MELARTKTSMIFTASNQLSSLNPVYPILWTMLLISRVVYGTGRWQKALVLVDIQASYTAK